MSKSPKRDEDIFLIQSAFDQIRQNHPRHGKAGIIVLIPESTNKVHWDEGKSLKELLRKLDKADREMIEASIANCDHSQAFVAVVCRTGWVSCYTIKFDYEHELN